MSNILSINIIKNGPFSLLKEIFARRNLTQSEGKRTIKRDHGDMSTEGRTLEEEELKNSTKTRMEHNKFEE